LIVIDASVLVGFLLDQEAAVTLVIDALQADASGVLHAPELIEPESLSALRGLERGNQITAEVASQAVADLADARLVRHPHAPLRRESGSCDTTSAATTPLILRSPSNCVNLCC
jgi:predicted nucleic acid-binding protein